MIEKANIESPRASGASVAGGPPEERPECMSISPWFIREDDLSSEIQGLWHTGSSLEGPVEVNEPPWKRLEF